MDNRVTVVFNGYKRSYAAKEQYEAYRNQSIGTPDFLFWGNMPEGADEIPHDKYVVDASTSAIANKNLGVWARFAYALNASTPFVCVVDDDTIPGKRWLESCIDTIHDIGKVSVLTTRGVRILNNNYPMPNSYEAIGWCSANKEREQVDFGGHCWFFPKQALRAFWLEAPQVLPLNYGEDIHISFATKMVMGGDTFVPPHPEDQPELWGSIKETASKYGEDMNATSRRGDASKGMYDYFNYTLQKGYVPVNAREK